MRFYLVCIAIFALMLFGLRSCGAEYVSVMQASSYHHGKGGEAKRKRLHRHHMYYGSVAPEHLRRNALSAAVPAPHEQSVSAGTTERNEAYRFDTSSSEPGRTPQQIIDDTFLNIGWK